MHMKKENIQTENPDHKKRALKTLSVVLAITSLAGLTSSLLIYHNGKNQVANTEQKVIEARHELDKYKKANYKKTLHKAGGKKISRDYNITENSTGAISWESIVELFKLANNIMGEESISTPLNFYVDSEGSYEFAELDNIIIHTEERILAGARHAWFYRSLKNDGKWKFGFVVAGPPFCSSISPEARKAFQALKNRELKCFTDSQGTNLENI